MQKVFLVALTAAFAVTMVGQGPPTPSQSQRETRAPRPKTFEEAKAWIDHLWVMLYDWPQLGRYRDDNARLGPAKEGDQRVVFIGDSITDFWKLAEYFPGKPYVNRGIDGQTTAQMLVRFRADVIDLAPTAVVILAGTNDIAHDASADALQKVERNYTSMADLAKQNNIRVVFSSVLPIHDQGPEKMSALRSPMMIRTLNNWLTQFCTKNKCTYLDYFSHMLADDGMLRRDLSDDGLHPNAAGYAAMAPLARQAIERAQKQK